ncbi:glycosyltransferase family 2 protein [Sinorhizobium sp. BJ1]|uniref:glycosyltransferase family 2 protein n=1 Tax=Sinorhizobium sp. BJ1 TaxID=2035455 RepID=UPI0015CF5DC6|nr:glycosyltransferase family 2 protein [Sinorhizobium sp. BJ1]
MGSIDVVIPNYNYGRFLRDCVRSVQAQAVENLRILIIDNASTDDSVEIARALATEDPRIEIIARKANKGLHASFNEGIDWASADYLIILHADDLSAPGALKRAMECLDRHPNVAMTCGGTVRYGEEIRTAALVPHWRLETGESFIAQRCRTAHNTVACCSVIVRTSAQKAAGHYDERLSFAPDLEMWLRLARVGDVAHTGAVQGFVRVHPHNASAHTRERLAPELEAVELSFETFFEKENAQGREVSHLRAQVQRSLAERAYWAGLAHLVRGSSSGGWELARMALSRRARMLLIPPVGYVLRRHDGIRRIGQVFLEARKRRFSAPSQRVGNEAS